MGSSTITPTSSRDETDRPAAPQDSETQANGAEPELNGHTRPKRRVSFPIVVIMVALVALVAVPLLSEWYVTPLREDTQLVSEVGRGVVTRIHVALAVQGSTVHDYLEMREPSLLERYREARQQEVQSLAQLEPLSLEIGRPVSDRFVELDSLQRRWHEQVDYAIEHERNATRDSLREQIYDDLISAAAGLDQAMSDVVAVRREQILRAERMQHIATISVAFLALIAAMFAARLGHRLRVAADDAEQRRLEVVDAARSRARLMRGLGHDLKNPLNAIDGHAQLLEDGIKGPLEPAQRESVERIRRAVRALLSLIDDILELSRAEAGQLGASISEVFIVPLVQECVADHQAEALASGHRLRMEEATDLPAIRTDPQRVNQILGNLLSNAFKYAEDEPEIIVRVTSRTRPSDPRGHWIAIDVEDGGPGIPKEKIESVFEEFSRLPTAKSKPGSGLGLSIARRVARLLGGDLVLASDVGRGSVFTLWLPGQSAGGRERGSAGG